MPKIRIKNNNEYYMLNVPEDKKNLFETKGIEKLNLDEVRGIADVLDGKTLPESKKTKHLNFKLPNVNFKPVLVIIGVVTLIYTLSPFWFYIMGVFLTFGMLAIPSSLTTKQKQKRQSFLLEDFFDTKTIQEDEGLKHKYASLRGLMNKLPIKK